MDMFLCVSLPMGMSVNYKARRNAFHQNVILHRRYTETYRSVT